MMISNILISLSVILSVILVFTRDTVKTAFLFVLNVLVVSILMVHLKIFFIAFAQTLVFAAVVAIMLIFTTMFINMGLTRPRNPRRNLPPMIGIILGSVLFGTLAIIIDQNIEYLNQEELKSIPYKSLFSLLLDKYIVPFELAAFFIFIMIIAITLVVRLDEK